MRVICISEQTEAHDDVQLMKLFEAAALDEEYKKIVEALREEDEPKKLPRESPC